MVSSNEMTKNYKDCRDKVESFDKVFVLKNNQPDAILYSIAEYERLSVFIEYIESLEDKDIAKVNKLLPKEAHKRIYSIGLIGQALKKLGAVDIHY